MHNQVEAKGDCEGKTDTAGFSDLSHSIYKGEGKKKLFVEVETLHFKAVFLFVWSQSSEIFLQTRATKERKTGR